MRKRAIGTFFAAALAAATIAGCFPLLSDDDDDGVTEADPITCDDEGYWPGDFIVTEALDANRLAGCRYIQGDLRVEDTDLVALVGLEEIRTVGGSVVIANNASLESLPGLVGLFEIEGELLVEGNAALEDLDDLLGLAMVGDVEVSHNAALEDIDGLDGLHLLDGRLILADNPSLERLPDLPHVTEIGTVLVEMNQVLAEAGGLVGVASVLEDVSLGGNPALASLSTLPNLRTLGGDLLVLENGRLVALDGFSLLETVGGNVVIDGAPGEESQEDEPEAPISSVSAFAALERVGGNLALFNLGLEDLDSLDAILAVGGALVVGAGDSDSLDYQTAQPHDGFVAADLHLSGNRHLTDVAGLSNLVEIGGWLSIRDNPALADLSGLAAVESCSSLWVDENPSLASLDGLAALRFLETALGIVDNPALPTCEAQELADRVVENGFLGSISISGNGDGGCDEEDPDGGAADAGE